MVFSDAVGDDDIWWLDISGTQQNDKPSRLISSTKRESLPQFSSDGRKIAFRSLRTGNAEIWVSDSGGTDLVQLTFFCGPLTGTPRWSPDGSQIAFDSRPEGNADIFVVRASGGKPRRMTTDPAEDIVPSWSHDGKWIYFCSSRTGERQIWKMPSTGGDAI